VYVSKLFYFVINKEKKQKFRLAPLYKIILFMNKKFHSSVTVLVVVALVVVVVIII
jgi:hypothetical protein